MKMMKLSSIFLLSLFFISAFIPEASARHCRNRTSFGLSFNVGGPGYAVAPAYVAPAPVYPAYAAPAYVAPAYAAPAYVAPAPYPYYYSAPAPVVVERPGVYVQPSFSYSHWRR